MDALPAILRDLPVHWTGVDDSTPAGCTLFCTTVVGVPTTYVLRNGQVIGRVEADGSKQIGYEGSHLKGGSLIGYGDFCTLAAKILAQHQHEQRIRALDAGQPDAARKLPRSSN